jgi:hypothetical protein
MSPFTLPLLVIAVLAPAPTPLMSARSPEAHLGVVLATDIVSLQ